jgi:hypothetical protein
MPAPGSTPIIIYNSATASQVPSAVNLSQGELAINVTDKKLYTKDSGGNVILIASNGGDVTGPATATDNAIARFDTTTGKLIQNSVVTIADTTGNMTGVGTLTATTVNAALNGTLGATTPSTVAATTISASGVSTFSAGTAGAPAITTAGDTNTGIFFPTADTIAFAEGGVEAMRIDSSGNVGLGVTPSPSGSTALQLNTRTILFQAGGGASLFGNNFYRNASVNEIYLTTAAASSYQQGSGIHTWRVAPSGTAGNIITFTTAMTLDASGNLGVGVTPSAWYATDMKALQFPSGSFSTYQTTHFLMRQNSYAASGTATETYVNNGFASIYSQVSGAHSWSIAPSGTAGNPITYTQAMTLNTSGQLAIGQTTATHTLDIRAKPLSAGYDGFNIMNSAGNGSVFNLSQTGTAYTFGSVGSNQSWLYSAYGDLNITNDKYTGGGSGIIKFSRASGTESMRIDDSGNVAIGNTAAGYDGTNNGIWLRGGVKVLQSSRNDNPAANFARTGTDGSVVTFDKGASFNVGSISITSSTTAYNTSSDYRLKENIAPMTGALATVAQLKPVTYNWKIDGSNGQGFIAHELAEVVPDCVVGEKDATEEQEYEISPAIPAVLDEEGNVVTEEVPAVMGTRTVPVYQGIDTSFLVATLTAAIQELKAELDITKAKVAALEAA